MAIAVITITTATKKSHWWEFSHLKSFIVKGNELKIVVFPSWGTTNTFRCATLCCRMTNEPFSIQISLSVNFWVNFFIGTLDARYQIALRCIIRMLTQKNWDQKYRSDLGWQKYLLLLKNNETWNQCGKGWKLLELTFYTFTKKIMITCPNLQFSFKPLPNCLDIRCLAIP